jgi:hypothetical protein
VSKKAAVLTGVGIVLVALIVLAHTGAFPGLTDLIRKVHGG